MAANVTLTGWKEFEAKASQMDKELLGEMDLEVLEAVRLWETLAKNSAKPHVDQGTLWGSIRADTEVTNHSAEVVSMAEYSAFIEWGTRTKVRVPAELQSYAAQFRGGGVKSGNAKAMIYAWMKRKGIDPRFWWIIFISIMRKGINPHPFFFIQSPIVEAQFLKACQNILNTEH